jgi:hypothetical protein
MILDYHEQLGFKRTHFLRPWSQRRNVVADVSSQQFNHVGTYFARPVKAVALILGVVTFI